MNWVSIGSGNSLAPNRHQAITWTNAGLLQTELLGTHFSENWIGIPSFSFKRMHLKLLSAKVAAILSRGSWVKLKKKSTYFVIGLHWPKSSLEALNVPRSQMPHWPGGQTRKSQGQIHGLVQDCSISSALAVEMLQYCAKPLIRRMISYVTIYMERSVQICHISITIYANSFVQDCGISTGNRIAWQWSETLVEIRGTLADIRGTTKQGSTYHFPKHQFKRPVCLEAHHYLLAYLSQ